MSYPSYEELEKLGKDVRDTAIRVTLKFAQYVGQTGEQMRHDPYAPNTRAHEQGGRGRPVAPVHSSGEYGIPMTAAQKAADTQYLMGIFDPVVGWFTQFARPNPADADAMLNELITAQTILRPGLEHPKGSSSGASVSDWTRENHITLRESATPIDERLRDISFGVRDWEGGAATSFGDNVLSPLQTSVNWQHDLVYILAVTLKTHQAIHAEAGENIRTIGTMTTQVLNALDPRPTAGWDGDDNKGLAIGLTVLAAVAGIVATVATGGTALVAGVGAAAAGGAGGVLSFFTNVDPETHAVISGGNPQSVVSSLSKAISKLIKNIDKAEREVASVLKRASAELAIKRNYENLVPPLTDAPDFVNLDGASYDTLNSSSGLYAS